MLHIPATAISTLPIMDTGITLIAMAISHMEASLGRICPTITRLTISPSEPSL